MDPIFDDTRKCQILCDLVLFFNFIIFEVSMQSDKNQLLKFATPPPSSERTLLNITSREAYYYPPNI